MRPAVTQDDNTSGRAAEIRERFQRQPQASSWLDAPRRSLRFLALAVGKARTDDLNLQSAALAFITLVSIIPLLSTLSIGAWIFEPEDRQQRIIDLLRQILPYSEDKLFETLRTFLDNAHTISGFGFVFFLMTALMAFSSIEQTINQIWNVPHRRPFRVRLLSFSLVLFWGPVVIGATYSGLFFLRRLAVFKRFTESLPAQIIPFAVTLVGLTMLYWQVPYTKVAFKNAFGGGFLATLLLEALRRVFGLYIELAQTVSIVYKSLGFVFFFMISVQLSWWIVLLGSEIAYCLQHYSALLRERRHAAAPEGSWLGLVAMAVMSERLSQGEPITPHEYLADRLKLPATELLEVLKPLTAAGLVRETGGDEEGFLLACDPHRLRLTEVFELYERDHWEVLEPLADHVVAGLEKLRARLAEARHQGAGDTVLADLVDTPSH